ncbi:Kynureninase [Sparassis crispa]|uniref:Kynureninase n=1 Tax=Sparassis crispa TaxID=139825 RepID=A0A401GII3_9APHY|nr:Kynureninase [Sparassis crispa]GBE82014.1 Kynureninase [Sparassis crispa]
MASPASTPERDPLDALRSEFVIPTNRAMKATAVAPELADAPCTYLCGNSLGVLPRRARALVDEEMEVWATRGVEGHFDHPHGRDWVRIADLAHPMLAELVGAQEAEVACMGTLTANLHLMLSTFYKPTAERYKILCEARAFPSDQYALASQVRARGLDPADAIIELAPAAGEHTLREDAILGAIARAGPALALVLFSGVQYYTGQLFPIARITRAARAQGCVCGWDLAHAVGNVPLALHAWGVDFAVWCSYKYLNAGPGGIGGIFVHERWADEPVRHAGWWGHDAATRFEMPPRFAAMRGAQGFQQSNPSVLATAALLGSLEVFRAAGGMGPLRARSVALTARLFALLRASRFFVPLVPPGQETARERVGVTVITPEDPEGRGAQLSLVFLPAGRGVMGRVMGGLAARGVVGDSRKPDVIRLAPCPLYNTFEDVERAVRVLDEVLEEVEREGSTGGADEGERKPE